MYQRINFHYISNKCYIIKNSLNVHKKRTMHFILLCTDIRMEKIYCHSLIFNFGTCQSVFIQNNETN